MSKKFSLDDEVVVIVGSGAGGGTLGNELAQKRNRCRDSRGRRSSRDQ